MLRRPQCRSYSSRPSLTAAVIVVVLGCSGSDSSSVLDPGPADGNYILWSLGGRPLAPASASENQNQLTGYRNRPLYLETAAGRFTVAGASLQVLTFGDNRSYWLSIVLCPGELGLSEVCTDEQLSFDWQGSHTVNGSTLTFMPAEPETSWEGEPLIRPSTWTAEFTSRRIMWLLKVLGVDTPLLAEFYDI